MNNNDFCSYRPRLAFVALSMGNREMVWSYPLFSVLAEVPEIIL